MHLKLNDQISRQGSTQLAELRTVVRYDAVTIIESSFGIATRLHNYVVLHYASQVKMVSIDKLK
jgi:hypothetical protein